MRARAILLAAALLLAPLTAAADLVVWWQLGQVNPGEDEVVRELVGAFERKTGKHVEVAFTAQNDLSAKTLAALAARLPVRLGRRRLLRSVGPRRPARRPLRRARAVGGPVRPGRARARHPARRHDGQAGALRAADGQLDPPRPRLEEPTP